MTYFEKTQPLNEGNKQSAEILESGDLAAVQPILPNEDVDVTPAYPIQLNEDVDMTPTHPIQPNEETNMIPTHPIQPNEGADVAATNPIQPDGDANVTPTHPIQPQEDAIEVRPFNEDADVTLAHPIQSDGDVDVAVANPIQPGLMFAENGSDTIVIHKGAYAAENYAASANEEWMEGHDAWVFDGATELDAQFVEDFDTGAGFDGGMHIENIGIDQIV